MKAKEIYEERIVVFIDILGFKNLVDNSESLNVITKVDNLAKIVHAVKTLSKEKNLSEGIKNDVGKKVSFFSDSLILSYPINETSISFLLMDLLHLSWRLINEKVLLRGGITMGNLYHEDNIAYGKAFIDAYTLESKYAIFPRIILQKKTYLEFKNLLKIDEINKLSWIKKDIDGFYYFDMLLAIKEEFKSEDDYPLFLKDIQALIDDNLTKGDLKLRQKYEWLQSKLDDLY